VQKKLAKECVKFLMSVNAVHILFVSGKAFGMIASLESLGIVLSAVFFNIIIYPATVDIFSGLAILIAALSLLFPLAMAM